MQYAIVNSLIMKTCKYSGTFYQADIDGYVDRVIGKTNKKDKMKQAWGVTETEAEGMCGGEAGLLRGLQRGDVRKDRGDTIQEK